MTHLESIASSAVRAAIKVKALVIICFTSSGRAARRISDLRGSGSSFPDLSGMTSMNKLDLSFNKLSGETPPSFASMGVVDYIYLSGNSLTANLPGWLLRRNKIARRNEAHQCLCAMNQLINVLETLSQWNGGHICGLMRALRHGCRT